LIEGEAELAAALAEIGSAENHWLLEERLVGRELSVGVLDARGAMGIVEIQVREAAQRVYTACGCRDYARVDFILSEAGTLYLLEINTLPGMKATSLLPMSARCAGLDFVALVRELVAPAVGRLREEASRSV